MDKHVYTIDTGVAVLGTIYEVRTATADEDSDLIDCDGYTNYYSKQIVLSRETDACDRLTYLKKLVRHEVIHAFLYESGLGENWEHKSFGQEETVIDWIALQHDKLHNAFSAVYAAIKEVTGDA